MKMNADLIQQQKRRRPSAAHGGTLVPVALLVLAGLSGCGRSQQQMGALPPPQVGVITVQPQALAITNNLPGRVDPVQIAQINARVDGVVLRREFEQGADVKSGQVLYQIDPAPYQASLDSAKASFIQAQQLADRDKPLVAINAVSKQNYDTAVATAAQDKAAEEIAQINLGYCTVTAPIAGRIGPALVTVGALVSSSAATEMAVIQQMDPIYADFTESSTEELKLRQELEAGQLISPAPGEAVVTLTMPDGQTYPHPGKLLFSDVTVNTNSGMITLRAEFPNPDDWLLPGMFVMAQLEQAISPRAILVPQPAVLINPDGSASVMVVSSNQVSTQPVQIGQAVGNEWFVKSGLNAGDVVMVDGFQKVRPGMTVTPVPAQPAPSASPASGN